MRGREPTAPGAELTGKGGNDQLKGTDSADLLDGGPGADTLTGGYGNDAITGGPPQSSPGKAKDPKNGAAASQRLAIAGHPTLRAFLQRGLTITVTGRKSGAKVAVAVRRGSARVAKGPAKASRGALARTTAPQTCASLRARRPADLPPRPARQLLARRA